MDLSSLLFASLGQQFAYCSYQRPVSSPSTDKLREGLESFPTVGIRNSFPHNSRHLQEIDSSVLILSVCYLCQINKNTWLSLKLISCYTKVIFTSQLEKQKWNGHISRIRPFGWCHFTCPFSGNGYLIFFSKFIISKISYFKCLFLTNLLNKINLFIFTKFGISKKVFKYDFYIKCCEKEFVTSYNQDLAYFS